jgi:tRNA nucleotidyltransferase/poly(A) polymerase
MALEKKFLEVMETISEESTKDTRLKKEEVVDMDDAVSKHNKSKSVFSAKKYKAYLHTCRHGENGENRPCTREIIEEKS